MRRAVAWSVVVMSHEECDRLGMHVANVEALRRAVAKLDVGPIPDGYLLVMGDNRGNSADSTAHMCADPVAEECPPTRGLVRVDDVVGKVFLLVWPRDHFQRITRPAVFEDIPDPK